MGIKLTPDLLKSIYDMLCEVEPFVGWNLPSSEDITFKVAKGKDNWGWYAYKDRKRTIAISKARHGHLAGAIMTMAHEMIHVFQHTHGIGNAQEHDETFWKLAEAVCDTHGWDVKAF